MYIYIYVYINATANLIAAQIYLKYENNINA